MTTLIDNQSPKLFSLLASISGKKTLVLDKSLSSLISSLASFSQLQEHGIESVKWLESTSAVESAHSSVLIIARPGRDAMLQVVQLVRASQDKSFMLVLLPRRTLLCDTILTTEGVLADLDIRVLPIHCTQEDTDCIRVDVPTTHAVVPPIEIYNIAATLMDLQKQHGIFGRLQGKGPNAEKLASLLAQNRAGLLIEEQISLEEDGLFGDCIILDRQTDLITPLLTQLTYEGLLYESFPIAANVLELPTSVQSAERKVTLGPNDAIFSDLKAENFSRVGEKLKGTATNLSQEMDSRHTMSTTSQLKAFVSHIPTLQSSQKQLRMHIDLTELLLAKTKTLEFRQILEIEQSLYSGLEADTAVLLESVIAQRLPLVKVLRLLCLWSQIHNGLKQKDYEFFCSRVVQAYGYNVQVQLVALNKDGLLVVRSAATDKGRGSWYGFSRTWKLVTEETETTSDIAYLYSGYAPLNLRILQGYLQPSFFEKAQRSALAVPSNARAIDAMMKQLRGSNVDVRQSAHRQKNIEERVLTVVFLGGYTAAEAAGVRYLCKKLNREVLIVGRGTMSGNDLIA